VSDPIKIECKVNLNGIDEKLIAIGPKLAKGAIKRALVAVGKLWINRLRGAVPVLSSELRDSIDAAVVMTKNGGTVTVGPTDGRIPHSDPQQRPSYYARFVEFGTKKMASRPFMRPVFDSTVEQVVEIFAEELKKGLEEAAKR